MEKSKRKLKGSPARDAFKHWHKGLPSWMYALDLDFVLVDKKPPPPHIVAVLDYKRPSEGITFTECIAFNTFLELGYPVFIVESKPHLVEIICPHCKGVLSKEPYFDNSSRFTIHRYLSGNWRPEPPEAELGFVARDLTSMTLHDGKVHFVTTGKKGQHLRHSD